MESKIFFRPRIGYHNQDGWNGVRTIKARANGNALDVRKDTTIHVMEETTV